MNYKITSTVIGTLLMAAASVLNAQDKQTLDLLVSKGIITKEEAASVSKKSVAVAPKEKTTKSIKLIGRLQMQYENINVDETVGGSIPKEYIEPVRKGIEEASKNGFLAGYEMVDFKATVYDGSYHEVDSSEMAFKIAGSLAFKDGMKRANPVLLEPIMKVEIVTPEDYFGDLMGNVSSRRGTILGTEDRNGSKVIDSFIPLSEMFGYATELRSSTQGRGQFTMQFDHFNECPKSISEKIIGERAVKHDD